MEFINLKAMYSSYAQEFDQIWKDHTSGAKFIGGEAVEHCEIELAEFIESLAPKQPAPAQPAAAKLQAITCSDGTNALILALKAAGIGAGDEVITSAFTFAATAEAIAHVGARPVFADIGPDYTLDPAAVRAALSPRTTAIIAVSLFGHCGHIEEIAQIASRAGVLLIEDAAQSFGALSASHQASCSIADISTTSFFPSKPLGCFGDGGAVFTRDAAIAQHVRLLANHGSQRRYEHELLGTNSRLDALQASVLRVRLRHFGAEIERRDQLAAKYSRALSAKLVLPRVRGRSVWAQYSVLAADRQAFCAALQRASVPTAVHYPLPLHLQPAFAHLGGRAGDLPQAEFAAAHICSLPFSAWLADDELARVAAAANEAAAPLHWQPNELAPTAAVFGCGKMGKNHIRELLKSGFSLRAYDVAPADLSEFEGALLEFCHVDDIANLAATACEQADLAIVATPTFAHAQTAQIAAKLAKTVIIEKPIAQSAKQAENIAASAFVGFNERFCAAFSAARRLLDGHALLRASFWRESPRPERIADVDVAMDLACHDLDLAQFLGFDITALELLRRDEDYFAARSAELCITASWQAATPRRAAVISAQDTTVGVDFLANCVYFGRGSTHEFCGEKFAQKIACAGFSNLAHMHACVLSRSAISGITAASAADGIKVLATLERLK